jgi:EAL domain-containing protein (putative c-di-GMP-specific phosphodiesterase class I)/CheY-like chemotaxis protein
MTLSQARTIWLVGAPQAPHLDAVQSVLEAVGFDVLRREGEAGVLRGAVQPDMILVDLAAESDQGLAFCEALRSREGWGQTPVVMLHDGLDAELVSRARTAGATEFLDRSSPVTLLEHRLNCAMVRTMDLIETLPRHGREESEGDVGFGSFQETLQVEIARARGTDDCVAVLSIMTSADSSAAIAHTITAALTQAVQRFESEHNTSYTKGEVVITRGENGEHYLLIPGLGRLQDAARLGYYLQSSLGQLPQLKGTSECGEVFVGAANFPGDGADAASLCSGAAAAAMNARNVGEGSLKFHNPATDRWVFERLTLERSLRRALERDELVLYYQPKVEADSRRLVGFEALLRWRHPELGMVSPAQFIPLAEETGLIVPIGEWVLETACRQCKAWQDAGFDPVRMAVNLSPVQFRQVGLADLVNRVLERTGLAPEHLELEVTESMLMQDINETIETLRLFKEAGVYLSIDDFGTGYSSLSYLKGFPIDALKIDQSFIREVTANTDDAAIATSIILMGRSLNLKVIAEGVETENQLAFLKVLQCNEIQGYLISPPVPAEEAQAFLLRDRAA